MCQKFSKRAGGSKLATFFLCKNHFSKNLKIISSTTTNIYLSANLKARTVEYRGDHYDRKQA